MATHELKRLEIACPGESSGSQEVVKKLNLKEFDVTAQSVEIASNTGNGPVRVSGICPEGELPIDTFYDDVNTLYDAFQRGLKLSRNANCIGWRNSGDEGYQWLSYEQVHKRARAFGSGLIKYGFEVGQDTMLGIFSKNCVEWVLSEQAASMFSMVVVPMYDSLSPSACAHICNKTEMKVIICNSEANANQILEAPEAVPTLKSIIVVNETSEQFIQKAGEKGITILRFKDVEVAGSEELKEPVPPTPDDICTICFTSGTTGTPKGAMLTHFNIIVGCTGIIVLLASRTEFRTGDVAISYLPLAHIYERYMQVNYFMHGASIGFFRGDPKLLLDDVACLRPTVFPCVPRVMNKLYDKVLGTVSEKNIISQMIFRKAFAAKKNEILSGTIRNNGIWDIPFKGIRKLLGGNIRMITTGAAPISPEVKMFFRIIFGCLVLEGYGQTETAGAITISHPNDLSDGHVGMIFPTSLVKLIDVPELDYLVENGQGEICVKGAFVFKGYYKEEEKTKETIDDEGYVLTGDVGEWLPNGQLKIIDRVKHIFKLSQGEYVAPECVENEYIRTEGVAQIFVHGESLQDCCVAIVVPDEEWVARIASQNQWEGDFPTLCGKQELRNILFEKMKQVAEMSDLKGFERVKKIRVHSVPFSVENEFLTPTFKSRRPNLRKYFKDVINEMYSELRGKRTDSTSQKAMTNGASTSGQKEENVGGKEDTKGEQGVETKGDDEEKEGAEGAEGAEWAAGERKGDEKDPKNGEMKADDGGKTKEDKWENEKGKENGDEESKGEKTKDDEEEKEGAEGADGAEGEK